VNAKAGAQESEPEPVSGPEPFVTPRPRPDTLIGVTKEIKTSCGKLYVTINRDEKGSSRCSTRWEGRRLRRVAIGGDRAPRLLALRSGVQPGMIVKQLKGISCHLPSWGGNGGKILSCADAVSKAIEWYLENFEAMFPGFRSPPPRPPAPRRRKHPFPPARRRSPAAPAPTAAARSSGRRGASSAAPAASPSADERHLRHL